MRFSRQPLVWFLIDVKSFRPQFDLDYESRPNWNTYSRLLELGARVRREQGGLCPRDMIDIQSFLWVQGSAEYEE